MRLALLGQPNSGKSTIFNWIAGYKSATANFPGTTVSYTISKVRLNGFVAELTDLPGIYSLAASDRAADTALAYLRQPRSMPSSMSLTLPAYAAGWS